MAWPPPRDVLPLILTPPLADGSYPPALLKGGAKHPGLLAFRQAKLHTASLFSGRVCWDCGQWYRNPQCANGRCFRCRLPSREEILRQWEHRIQIMVNRIISNPSDRDDGVQVAKMAMLNNYDKLARGDIRNIEAWLSTLIKRAVLDLTDHRAYKQKRPKMVPYELVEKRAPLELTAADLLGPVEDRVSLAAWRERWLGRINQTFAETFDLVELRQMSYAEAASIQGVPVGTIQSRLHRAKRALRDAMGHDVGQIPFAVADAATTRGAVTHV